MTELEKEIQQAAIEKARKYPLLDISDNRKEIREIAQRTQDYMIELNPDVKRIKIWEAIPRIVIEFIKASFTKLSKSDTAANGVSSVIIGDIMELGIEYLVTSDAAGKEGNITPFIRCRSEFKWENNAIPYRDEVPADIAKELREEKCEGLPIQFYDNRDEIKDISLIAAKVLEDEAGIILGVEKDWWLIPLVVVSFFRKTKEFLIEHKDDGEIGIDIDFANLIQISICKEGGMEEDDPIDYILSITPQQIFKKDNAKDDNITEN